MEFTVLFLAVTVVMLIAWRGSRSLTLTLFGVTLAGLRRDLSASRHRYAEPVVLEHDPEKWKPVFQDERIRSSIDHAQTKDKPMTRAIAITLNAVSLYAVALVLA